VCDNEAEQASEASRRRLGYQELTIVAAPSRKAIPMTVALTVNDY